jgi:hypothetical protein
VVEVSLADRSRRVGGVPVGDMFPMSNKQGSHSLAEIEFRSLGDLGLASDKLIKDLESNRLGRVLTSATLKLTSGQPGSLQVQGTTVAATATVTGEKIRVNYRFSSKAPDSKLRDTATGAPGYREQKANFTVELEPGRAVMLPLPPTSGKPLKTVAVVVQASLASPPQASLHSQAAEPPTRQSVGPKSGASQPLAASLSASGQTSAVTDPKIPLLVGLRIVQIDNEKLRRLRFEWTQLASNGETTTTFATAQSLFDTRLAPENLNGFIEALRQNNLARVLAEPTLVTLSGRPASFVAGGTQVDLVPVLVEEGRVRLECHTKLANDSAANVGSGQSSSTPGGAAAFRFNTKTEMQLGRLHALGVIRLPPTSGASRSQDVETIVLAKVDRFLP